MKAALLAMVVMLGVAGCGSTTVVTKTRYVHPCATAKQMTACIATVIRASVKAAGDTADVQVECSDQGGGFSCLRLIVYAADDQTDCARMTIRRIGPGIPFLTAAEISGDCARWTS